MAEVTDTRRVDTLSAVYAERWAAYKGTLFTDKHLPAGTVADRERIYKNTRLLVKHIAAVVNFYAANVYQGALSSDGKPLPNGSLGAIPIDAQTGQKRSDKALLEGAAALHQVWNWQQNMSLIPRFCAAMGDCFVELIDIPSAGAIHPKFIWPGYVVAIELDGRGNVDAYTLEYRVRTPDESYLFRKEVDGDAYRYFRDGRPHAYAGQREVEPNPYGFVPATLDRHAIDIGPDGILPRGLSAVESTRQALYEVNAFMSHALDFQRRSFEAPIIVAGGTLTPYGVQEVQVLNPDLQEHPDRAKNLAEDAMDVKFWQSRNGDVSLQQPVTDLGQTLGLHDAILASVLDENPEARFYKDLRAMSQATAPGIERALGDAVALVRLARGGQDTNTRKRIQMALAMSGNRIKTGDWQAAGKAKGVPDDGLNATQRLFAPFDLDSYKAGRLDFTILDRPIVEPSDEERLDIIKQTAALGSRWEMRRMGLSEEDITEIMAERAARTPLSAGTGDPGAGAAAGGDDEDRPTSDDEDRRADPLTSTIGASIGGATQGGGVR